MKRYYTVSVKIQATFGRKIKSRKAKRELLDRIEKVLPTPWRISSASVTSKTVSEAEKPEKQPSATAIMKAAVLERARDILQEIRTCSPTLPKVTLRFYGHKDGGCGDFPAGAGHAHAHRGQWYTHRPWNKPTNLYRYGRRVRLPKNLVCLAKARQLINYTDERMAKLLCHEITHISMQKGHGTKDFRSAAERYFSRWKASRGL